MNPLKLTRNAPVLTAAAAQLLLDAAQKKATDIGVPQCVVVVDPAGDLIAFIRMDGAKTMSIQTALKKAITAARTRNHSGPLPDHLGLTVAAASDGNFTELQGGRAIYSNDQLVGAIGVGSGTPEQDVVVADAAISALEL